MHVFLVRYIISRRREHILCLHCIIESGNIICSNILYVRQSKNCIQYNSKKYIIMHETQN